ncbi:SPL family radical SAM protein [Candidatus Soleaferrea massiliensis]|uniref:SPL family radical SAM protein n=1 Tax=Candidatus Soleaferrea massiliensis TaxID=1470354 RepID=UPI00058BD0C7|nr:spore photoproduct lyase [Candidatus Soleaferrea massiliensis]
MTFTTVYYEPDSLNYPLGKQLREQYKSLPWIPIESHNRIPELTARDNRDFARMKQYLIIGTRKTHRYVENQKISDYLVPFTSSGCSAMCLYCYLVCNYNKCSYLRLFVNREQMLDRLIRTSHKTGSPCVFEIGSNSDLLLENTVTQNLEQVIPAFAKEGRGQLTFPTKFDMVEPLLSLDHRGKTIFRMSVNPNEIIRRVELGTSPLEKRISALNRMAEAGYPAGLLIAPVILLDGWKTLYGELIDQLADTLSGKTRKSLPIEIILMTYSYVHRAINQDAFPNAVELYSAEQMIGGGRGKYRYRQEHREPAEQFFREQLARKLPEAHIAYIC